MRRLFIFAIAAVCSLAALGQGVIHDLGDPRTKVPPPNCARSPFYLDDSTQQLYIATSGSPCVWSLPGGGASFPGVAADGSNGLGVTGAVAAGNLVGPLQQSQNYVPRATLTKLEQMTLYLNGVSGYTNPAQLYFAAGGDSTTAFHAAALYCALTAKFGVAGYIGQNGMGVSATNQRCGLQPTFGPTLTGGAAQTSGDYAHFRAGVGYSIPSGGTATTAQPSYSTRQLALYTADVGTVTVTVSTSTDNVTFTPLTGCNGIAVTAAAGGVCDVTVTRGRYYLRVAAGGTGTLYLWTGGQVDTTVNGIVNINFGVGGTSLPDDSSTPSALENPWFAAIAPDLLTFEMKNNGGNTVGVYPACLQATTAAPAVGQSRSYWWNLFTAPLLAANPLMDTIYFGSYDVSDQCIQVYNNYARSWVQSRNPQQIFVENYAMLSNAQMVSLGWIPNGNVHATALGQLSESDLDMNILGVENWPSAWSAKDVANNNTATGALWIGSGLGPWTPKLGLQSSYPATRENYLAGGQITSDTSGNIHSYLGSNDWFFHNYNNTTMYLCIGTNLAQCGTNYGLYVTSNAIQGQGSWTLQNSAAQAPLLLKSTLASAAGHAALTLDKGASGAEATVDYSVNGTLTWRAGMHGNANYSVVDQVNSKTPFLITANAPTNSISISSTGAVSEVTSHQAPLYLTTTNCSSAAAPAVCSAAPAGSVAIAAAGTTVTVNTTAVTANSQIFLQEDSSLGTKLSVTCNTTTGRLYTVTARTAGTSFVITASAAPTTNPACLSYSIVN